MILEVISYTKRKTYKYSLERYLFRNWPKLQTKIEVQVSWHMSHNVWSRLLPIRAPHFGQRCLNSFRSFMKNGIKQQPPTHPTQMRAMLATQARVRGFSSTLVRTRVLQDGQITRTGMSSSKLANWRGTDKLPRAMVKHTTQLVRILSTKVMLRVGRIGRLASLSLKIINSKCTQSLNYKMQPGVWYIMENNSSFLPMVSTK